MSAMDASPRVVWMPGRVRTEIHLASQDTGGAFCMLVDYPPVGGDGSSTAGTYGLYDVGPNGAPAYLTQLTP